MKKLPKTQQELLDALHDGVVVHYLQGVDSYYWRQDNLKKVTSAACSLISKNLCKVEGSWNTSKLVLTDAGKARGNK